MRGPKLSDSSDSFSWDEHWRNAKSQLTLTLRTIWNAFERHAHFEGKSYLEIGCGTGVFGKLALDAGASRVCLLDSSENALKMCKDYIGEDDRVEYVLSDAREYRAERNFDIVVSNGLIEHFKERDLVEILEAHSNNSKDIVVFIPPASPHFNNIRCRYGWALQSYGPQRPVSKKIMRNMMNAVDLEKVCIERFYPLYGIKINMVFPFQNKYFALMDYMLLRFKVYHLMTAVTNPLGGLLGGCVIGIGRVKKGS